MAKYKNREVTIVQELPHPQGAQVLIEHLELMGQREIVPKNQVVLTKDEKKAVDEAARKEAEAHKNEVDPNDYRIEGETDQITTTLPTVAEVKVQRQAEDNFERAEKQRQENEEWTKKHPQAPANAKQQLDSIKVVPYKDEPKKVVK